MTSAVAPLATLDAVAMRHLANQVRQVEQSLVHMVWKGNIGDQDPTSLASELMSAKDHFSQLKFALLEHETKKRVLDHVMQNGIVPHDQETVALSQQRMQACRAASRKAKEDNKQLRHRLQDTIRAIVARKRELAGLLDEVEAVANTLEVEERQSVDLRTRRVELEAKLQDVERQHAAEQAGLAAAREEEAGLRQAFTRAQGERRALEEAIAQAATEVASLEDHTEQRSGEVERLGRMSQKTEW